MRIRNKSRAWLKCWMSQRNHDGQTGSAKYKHVRGVLGLGRPAVRAKPSVGIPTTPEESEQILKRNAQLLQALLVSSFDARERARI